MTDRKLGDRVTGHAFSRDEFSEEERAQTRHRHTILDEEFRTPDGLLAGMSPRDIGRHLGLEWLAAPSRFVRDNKALIVGVIGVMGALNWEKISEIAKIIAEVMQ